MKLLSRQNIPAPRQRAATDEPAGDRGAGHPAARRLATAAAGIALALALVALGHRWIVTTPGLAIRRIVLTGVEQADADALRAATGALGVNALSLDVRAVRERLMAQPWIADATVRRSLPHDLLVAVRERQPVAVEDLGETTRVVDIEGRVLGDRPVATGSLPVLAGLPSARAAAARGDEAVAARADAVALGASTLAAIREQAPAYFARIRSMDVSDTRKLVITADGAPEIWVSGPQSADEVAAWARRERGIARAVGRVSWVDARWRDRLVAGPG